MNLDEVFGLRADAPLTAANPFLLLACILTAVVIGWLCVRRWRGTNDFAKSAKLFLPFAIGGAVFFRLLGLPLLFTAGAQLCSFGAMALISNYYFCH